ncbi:MAG: hypothetical protein HY714_01580 [Candidatus Omnitrophica bacterium]|nr:hypothetical protein [Candidatus Omnitrophota bacterium]
MGLFDFFSRFRRRDPNSAAPHPLSRIFHHVEIALWKPHVYRAERGELQDLTLTGFRVMSYWQVSRGSKVELNLEFPAEFPVSPHTIRLHARIKRCRKPLGHRFHRIEGVFTDLEPASQEKIRNFLDWAAQKARLT